MSHPGNDSQLTIGIERRRREAAVKVGRLQVLIMVKERKMDSYERKIQDLLQRNHGLGSLLEEIEKENEEEQHEAGLEVDRRKKVAKLWRLQAKVMEREGRLERQKGLSLKLGKELRKYQDTLEVINQTLEHVHSEDVLGSIEDMIKISEEEDLDLPLCDKQIQEEEKEAQALR